MKKLWRILFLMQVFAGVNAIVLFRIYDRPTAGLIAGLVFAAVGVASFTIFLLFAKNMKKVGLLVSGIYLFVFAMPLSFVRLTTPLEVPIEEVFTVPLSVFHRGSEIAFLTTVCLTLLQIWFTRNKK